MSNSFTCCIFKPAFFWLETPQNTFALLSHAQIESARRCKLAPSTCNNSGCVCMAGEPLNDHTVPILLLCKCKGPSIRIKMFCTTRNLWWFSIYLWLTAKLCCRLFHGHAGHSFDQKMIEWQHRFDHQSQVTSQLCFRPWWSHCHKKPQQTLCQHLQYTVMAFGICNPTAIFSSLWTLSWVTFHPGFVPGYIYCHSSNFCSSFTSNLAKCEFGKAFVTDLGKQIGCGQVCP